MNDPQTSSVWWIVTISKEQENTDKTSLLKIKRSAGIHTCSTFVFKNQHKLQCFEGICSSTQKTALAPSNISPPRHFSSNTIAVICTSFRSTPKIKKWRLKSIKLLKGIQFILRLYFWRRCSFVILKCYLRKNRELTWLTIQWDN